MRCSAGLHTQREYNSVIEFWLDSTEPFATVSYEDGLAPFHSFLSFNSKSHYGGYHHWENKERRSVSQPGR